MEKRPPSIWNLNKSSVLDEFEVPVSLLVGLFCLRCHRFLSGSKDLVAFKVLSKDAQFLGVFCN